MTSNVNTALRSRKARDGRRARPAAFLLLAAALTAVTYFSLACAGGKPDAAAKPNRSAIDVLHYDVSLKLDFDDKAITSATRIAFLVRRAESEIHFSRIGLTLDSVSMNGQALRFENDEVGLTIHFPRELTPGARAEIAVKAHGEAGRGLEYEPHLVYSNYFTCDWMICALDDFRDKASLRLTLEFPAGASSVAPGRHISRTRLADGRLRDVWSERRAYSAYLFGFAVGDFTVATRRAGRAELAYFAAGTSEGELLKSFAPTPGMVEFFEQKSGVRLPQARYSQVLVSGDVAQEKVNFSLIGADLIAALAADPGEDWVIAHELAHQWWGNSLTCSDLSQFWLNEGITVFMVVAWKEHRWGRSAYDRELQLARQRVEAAKAAGVDRKLTSRDPYPSLPLRRAIQYSKGALFMDRLRQELGDEPFWRALKAYTSANVGKTVASRDLQRAFEASARRDLSGLFEEWVYDHTPASASKLLSLKGNMTDGVSAIP
jgi:aminopeptidase N